jgi:aryl sulfotransferase
MGVRPATTEVRGWTTDSRRWAHYVPRDGDIVISTPPKCGTTWTQQIVSLLIFQTPEARPIQSLSPWIDYRVSPIEDTVKAIAAQTHRRFLKAHLPSTALPLHDNVRYIHTARDGRDAFMSWHNHSLNYSKESYDSKSAAGLADDKVARPLPRPAADPREYFQTWMAEGKDVHLADDFPAVSFFEIERSFWADRKRENVLLVHYNDMKADLVGEMGRIASFLNIDLSPAKLAELAEAASFSFMRENGAKLMPRAANSWDKGHERFFNKGVNARWRDVLTAEDLAKYDDRVRREVSPALAAWLENGRLKTRDPRVSED